MSQTLPDFLTDTKLRVLIFGGKGGVGKTTAACSTAVHLARTRAEHRFLLVSTDPAHSVKDCFSGTTPPENLNVVEFDSGAKHREFIEQHANDLREIAKRGTFLDGDDVDRFMDLSLPGIDELMAFLQIATWIEEDRYQTIIVDTAPTGHALRLLQMPRFVGKWMEAMEALMAKHRYMASLFGGRGRRRTGDEVEEFLEGLEVTFDAASELLTDATACRFVPVMIAEPMSVAETSDLMVELKDLEVPTRQIVINRVIPASSAQMSEIRRRQIEALRAAPAELSGLEWWGVELQADEPTGVDRLAAIPSKMMSAADVSRWMQTGAGEAESVAAGLRVNGNVPLPAVGACKLVFFAGKGGVGKTTMACAAASALAATGTEDVLLVSVDPAHSTADCLRLSLDGQAKLLGPRLWAMELDAAREFEQLKEQYLGEIEELFDEILGGADMAYDREAMEHLLDLAPPGLDEIMALIKVIDLIESGKFGVVVLDTAPTGHLLRLLHLPELIEQWTGGIFNVLLKYQKIVRLPKITKKLIEISKGVKRVRSMVRDGVSACLFPVTIATEMALAESGDLVEECRASSLPIPGLIVNQLTPPGTDLLGAAIAQREAGVLETYRKRFSSIPISAVYRSGDLRGLEAVSALGKSVFEVRALSQRKVA
jgi:arsenite-transporting ATPase